MKFGERISGSPVRHRSKALSLYGRPGGSPLSRSQMPPQEQVANPQASTALSAYRSQALAAWLEDFYPSPNHDSSGRRKPNPL